MASSRRVLPARTTIHNPIREPGHNTRLGYPWQRRGVDQDDIEVPSQSCKLLTESQRMNQTAFRFSAIAGGQQKEILDPAVPHEPIERCRSSLRRNLGGEFVNPGRKGQLKNRVQPRSSHVGVYQ